MRSYKRKIVVFLAIVALCGAASVCSAQSSSGKISQPTYDKSFKLETDKQPTSPTGPESFNTRQLFFKVMAASLFVAILGLAVLYLSKKLLPKFTNKSGKQIKILETAHLGPRRTVHLLQVGNQQFLIGSTNENITKLADIKDQTAEIEFPDIRSDHT